LTLASPVPLLPDASVLAARDLLYALPLGLVGLALLRLELLRGPGRAVGDTARPWWRQAALGAAAALGLLAVTVLPPFAAGAFRPGAPGFSAYPASPSGPAGGAAGSLAFFAVQSLVEELLFRAFLLTLAAAIVLGAARLLFGALPPRADAAGLPRFGRRWLAAGALANAVQAVLFAWLHAGNPHVTPLALLNIGLAGAVIGWLFWSGGGLAGAWTFHGVWNAGLAALGLPVSGMMLGAPLVAAPPAGAGRPLLSGGPFGPEGSAVATVAFVALLLALVSRSARRLPNG